MKDYDIINKKIRLYYSGLTQGKIAEIYGVTRAAISETLRAAGVTSRYPLKTECHCGKTVYKYNLCEYHYFKTYEKEKVD